MNQQNQLMTGNKNTWCPGCGNFGILAALKKAIENLIEQGTKKENIVLVTGIGCSAKIADYLNINSFYGLHGREIATAQGIKLANPELKVIVVAGDGGAYNEGISHLIHTAKRNSDLLVLVANNRLFALTTGQFTATSPTDFEGASSPEGLAEKPLNPLKLMISSGATFVARGYSLKQEQLNDLINRGLNHEGFAFIDVLQSCVSLFDVKAEYDEKLYELEEDNLEDQSIAFKKAEEWDYDKKEAKIPLGLFFKNNQPSFEKEFLKDFSKNDTKE